MLIKTRPDSCRTAADVMAAAATVRAKRAASYQPPQAPERPKRLTFLPPPAEPEPEQLVPEVEEIISATCAKFCVDRDLMLSAIGVSAATGALTVASGLCVRRLLMPQGKVCAIFGLADSILVGALRFVDSVLVHHSVTRYAKLPLVIELLFEVWRDESEKTKRFSFNDIVRAVCRVAGVSDCDLRSARRTSEVVRPRQAAMALCKHLTLKSLPEIGRRFGGRDHTTVLHACRKFAPVIAGIKSSLGPDASLEDWARAALEKADVILVRRATP